MKKHLPNALTCGNLLCGCAGIALTTDLGVIMGFYAILAGACFDFLDGFVARLLKVTSPIGKELDSLADMVTFGVLPGLMMMKMIYNGPAESPFYYATFIGLLLPLGAALRLARFNVDTRQTDRFLGLPTPAAALLIGGLPVLISTYPMAAHYLSAPVMLVLTLVTMGLMVSSLPLMALKFKSAAFGPNRMRYLLVLLSAGLLLVFGLGAFPFIILLYILLSIIDHFLPQISQPS